MIVFLLLVTFLCSLCLNAQSFKKVEGTEKYVYSIKISKDISNQIMVASDSIQADWAFSPVSFFSTIPGTLLGGVGVQYSNDGGNSFDNLFVEKNMILDIQEIESGKWAATGVFNTIGNIFYLESNDQTKFSDIMVTAASSDCSDDYQSLRLDSKNGRLLSALQNNNNALLEIDVLNDNCNFIELSTALRDIKYSEIDNMVFGASDFVNPGVFRNELGEDSWQSDEKGLSGFRINCVLPSSFKSGLVFCGADTVLNGDITEGRGIYMSVDSGRTWKQVYSSEYSIFDLEEHPDDPRLISAAADKGGVLVSSNCGNDWSGFQSGFSDLENSPIRVVTFKNLPPEINDNKISFELFAGSFGDGLYSSDQITMDLKIDVSINENLADEIRIAPNPASEKIRISSSYSTKSVKIYSSTGTLILTEYNSSIDISKLATGIYFVEITLGDNQKVIKNITVAH